MLYKEDNTSHAARPISRVGDSVPKTAEKTEAGSVRHFIRMMVSMLRIGFTGFGGGSAMIPVIEEEVVDEQHLVTKSEYDEDVIAACVTPGALPVEIAAGLGRRSYGMKGMIAAAALMAFPGALLTVLIQSLLSGSSQGALNSIQYLSIGISAFIASLLAGYAVKTEQASAQVSRKNAIVSLIVIAGVFLLTCGKNLYAILGVDRTPIFGLSTISILALAFFIIFYTQCRFTLKNGIISAAVSVLFLLSHSGIKIAHATQIGYVADALMVVLAAIGVKRSVSADIRESGAGPDIHVNWREPLHEAGVWGLFLAVLIVPALIAVPSSIGYVLKGLLSSVLSFGGGDAYLSVADGLFVGSGISRAAFYSKLVPVANVLPGSILCKILSGIGYAFGFTAGGSAAAGFLTALAGFGVSVAASGLVFGIVAWLFRTFENISVFQTLNRWIRPIISGLLLNVMLTMIRTNIYTGSVLGKNTAAVLALTLALTAANLFLQLKNKSNAIRDITFSAAIGTAVLVLMAL